MSNYSPAWRRVPGPCNLSEDGVFSGAWSEQWIDDWCARGITDAGGCVSVRRTDSP